MDLKVPERNAKKVAWLDSTLHDDVLYGAPEVNMKAEALEPGLFEENEEAGQTKGQKACCLGLFS